MRNQRPLWQCPLLRGAVSVEVPVAVSCSSPIDKPWHHVFVYAASSWTGLTATKTALCLRTSWRFGSKMLRGNTFITAWRVSGATLTSTTTAWSAGTSTRMPPTGTPWVTMETHVWHNNLLSDWFSGWFPFSHCMEPVQFASTLLARFGFPLGKFGNCYDFQYHLNLGSKRAKAILKRRRVCSRVSHLDCVESSCWCPLSFLRPLFNNQLHWGGTISSGTGSTRYQKPVELWQVEHAPCSGKEAFDSLISSLIVSLTHPLIGCQMTFKGTRIITTVSWYGGKRDASEQRTQTEIWSQTNKSSQLSFIPKTMNTWRTLWCRWVWCHRDDVTDFLWCHWSRACASCHRKQSKTLTRTETVSSTCRSTSVRNLQLSLKQETGTTPTQSHVCRLPGGRFMGSRFSSGQYDTQTWGPGAVLASWAVFIPLMLFSYGSVWLMAATAGGRQPTWCWQNCWVHQESLWKEATRRQMKKTEKKSNPWDEILTNFLNKVIFGSVFWVCTTLWWCKSCMRFCHGGSVAEVMC